MSELIPIVNLNDEITWYKSRKEITSQDVYRVSALWIENSKGEILLAQRGFMKRNNPGKWWSAVAGTVDKWESYEENIYKEAEEELGIKEVKFDFVCKKYNAWPKYFYFCEWYECILDWDISKFVIEYPEVEQVRWFSREELQNLLENTPEILSGVEFMKYKLWL